MNASSQLTAAKSSALASILSLLSHMIVVPVAAWNHNLFLVVVAATFPMFFMMVLRKTGKLPKVSIPARHWVKSVAILAAMTTVATVIFWNHLWLVALVLVALIVIVKTRFTVR